MKNVKVINGINGINGWVTLLGHFHSELIEISSYENFILMTVSHSNVLPQETILLWNTQTDGTPTSEQLFRKAVRWIRRHFSHDMWEKEEALSVWDD